MRASCSGRSRRSAIIQCGRVTGGLTSPILRGLPYPPVSVPRGPRHERVSGQANKHRAAFCTSCKVGLPGPKASQVAESRVRTMSKRGHIVQAPVIQSPGAHHNGGFSCSPPPTILQSVNPGDALGRRRPVISRTCRDAMRSPEFGGIPTNRFAAAASASRYYRFPRARSSGNRVVEF